MGIRLFTGTRLLAAAGAAILFCTGCSTLGYYAYSAHGHLSLLAQRKPIDHLVLQEDLSTQRRNQLKTALEIRAFASNTLHLPDNGSYRSFVELGRPYAIWSVMAAPEFSLTPKEWCFPVAGCVTYRGYYQENKANAFAASLRAQGLEAWVGGVRAYSTLGWFDDPLLSSMMDHGDMLTAEVVFHELAHQQLYFPNDTVFNEAFASAVGEFGVRQWLKQTRPDNLERYEHSLSRKNDFVSMLDKTSGQLRKLYASDMPEEAMRIRKQAILRQLQDDYQTTKREKWGGYKGYDPWFARPVNNARLASVSVYHDRVPDFMRWLGSCGNNLPRFYAAMRQMRDLDKAGRHAHLRSQAKCFKSLPENRSGWSDSNTAF